jgi:tRNA U55 pseudouridine synthase TruB
LKWENPLLTLEIECSSGTYIRSLAHDLGQRLGCPAHLAELVRLRSGDFSIKEAVGLTEIEEAFRNAMDDPDFVKTCENWEVLINYGDSEAAKRAIEKEYRLREKWIKLLNVPKLKD